MLPRILKFLCLVSVMLISGIVSGQVKTSSRPRILNNHDGRFTLGNGDQRLMYGFPIPTSTSHFIIKIDTLFLSNNPSFQGKKHFVYLKGKSLETGLITKTVETQYVYGKFKITQRLVPADKNMKEILNSSPAQYYIARYEIQNLSVKQVNIGMLLLFDTMVDDNDCCQMQVGGTAVDLCSVYGKEQIPASVFLFHQTGHPEDQMGDFKPTTDISDPPDSMFIGNWPHLHEVTWVAGPEKGSYTDSGILLKWNETPLNPQASLKHAAAYGIPVEKKGDVRILIQAPDMQRKVRTIYFDIGKWDLDLNGTMILDEIVKGTSGIKGVLIQGFSDAAGTAENAKTLSDKRIQKVSAFFEKNNIPTVPKSHGNQLADFSDEYKKEGNPWDRKVIIEVYY